MKKFLLPFLAAAFGAFCLNLSCSTKTPSSPNNFQSAVSIISAINPTLTFTPTPSFTFTPTFTLTFTPTITSTPYVTATIVPWTGLNAPSGIAVDNNGFVYVADTGNNRVGKYTSNGVLVAIWGSGGIKGKIPVTDPVGVAVDKNFNLYVAGNSTNTVNEFNSAATPVATFTSANSQAFSNLQGVAVDQNANLYISDTGNQRIVELTSGSTIIFSTLPYLPPVPTPVPSTVSVFGIALDGSGDVFGAAANNTVIQYTGGSPVTVVPGFSNPIGVATDSSGNLWVADTGNKQVEEFQAGMINQVPLVIFNDGGLLQSPKGIAVDASGNIYVTDSVTNQVIKFTP